MKKVIELINKSESVIILGHISEDADSVGSSLAMRHVLEGMGKKADILFSAPLEKRLDFLNAEGFYPEDKIGEYELCLCLDCGDIGRLGARRTVFDAAKHTASIDHHITNTNFAEVNYVVPDAAATGEILYDVIKELGAQLDKKAAEYLFAAIASDTGSFKYSNVSPKTMRIAAELLEKGIDNAYLSRMLFDTESEKIMHFKGHLMSRVETHFGGRMSVIAVRKDEFDKFGVPEKDMGDIVNIARMVEGAEIAVSLRETEDKMKLSFRSNGKYDVGALAQKFGGGGHKMASGAAVGDKSFDEMYKHLLEICGELFDD